MLTGTITIVIALIFLSCLQSILSGEFAAISMAGDKSRAAVFP